MIRSRRSPSDRARAQLEQLFSGPEGPEHATAWARAVLDEAGFDASRTPLRALRALRRADRRLSPIAARYLVDAVAGHGDRGSVRRAWNPLLH